MKRYQCIKAFHPFQAGKIYIGSDPGNRSNKGRIMMNVSSDVEPVFLTPAQLADHFSIVDDWYGTLDNEGPGLLKCCAYCAAVGFLIAIFILWIIW